MPFLVTRQGMFHSNDYSQIVLVFGGQSEKKNKFIFERNI